MRRTLVQAAVLAVVSLLIGVFMAIQAFPSEEEIERVSLEEIARDSPLLGQILQSPIVQAILDETFGETQDRVRDRVLDESRSALYLGAGSTILVMVAGVGLIAADHRRRHPAEATPGEPEEPAS